MVENNRSRRQTDYPCKLWNTNRKTSTVNTIVTPMPLGLTSTVHMNIKEVFRVFDWAVCVRFWVGVGYSLLMETLRG